MNYMHRDIKAKNVLVGKNLENEYILKLADFGESHDTSGYVRS